MALAGLAEVARLLQPLPAEYAAPLPTVIHGPSSANARPGAYAPRNCTEARAMGLQNIPRGSPYYGQWLDRDNDGYGCEPWPVHRR